MTLGLLHIDQGSAAHIARALASHARWCRDNGVPVPPAVVDVAEACADWARAGLSGPENGGGAAVLHDQPVEQAQLLTIPSAARYIGVSQSTVKRLIEAGELAAVVVGKTRRVRRSDCDDYVSGLAPGGSFRGRVQTKGRAS